MTDRARGELEQVRASTELPSHHTHNTRASTSTKQAMQVIEQDSRHARWVMDVIIEPETITEEDRNQDQVDQGEGEVEDGEAETTLEIGGQRIDRGIRVGKNNTASSPHNQSQKHPKDSSKEGAKGSGRGGRNHGRRAGRGF